jgi:hypothetical protein
MYYRKENRIRFFLAAVSVVLHIDERYCYTNPGKMFFNTNGGSKSLLRNNIYSIPFYGTSDLPFQENKKKSASFFLSVFCIAIDCWYRIINICDSADDEPFITLNSQLYAAPLS